MARYRIESSPKSVGIEVTEVAGKHRQLLAAFRECSEGRCSCPTDEFENVASMKVESADDRIGITLEAKPGRDLRASEIAKCLDHTLADNPRSG